MMGLARKQRQGVSVCRSATPKQHGDTQSTTCLNFGQNAGLHPLLQLNYMHLGKVLNDMRRDDESAVDLQF